MLERKISGPLSDTDRFFTSSIRKILVAGNSPRWREQLRHQLDLVGLAEIFEAASAEEAFEVVGNTKPSALISTLSMQPDDGIALTTRLRRDENSPQPYIPIMLIATRHDRYRVIEARDAGVNNVLYSPFSFEELQTQLHEMIENPRPFIRVRNYFGPDRRMQPRSGIGIAYRR